jgi:hypothetical protein
MRVNGCLDPAAQRPRLLCLRASASLREAVGHDPVGWLAPRLTETLDTLDLLVEADTQ